MDYWNNINTKIFNTNPTFFSQSSAQISSSNLLNNSFLFDRFPGLEVIMHQQGESSSKIPSMQEVDEMKVTLHENEHEIKIKRRLSTNQLESLETSFEEERKLNPDRKMKLAKELGLQPRQVAIWFQNRRARWKSKKLEHLYHALKIEFDVVSKENQKLQQEVQRLKAILKEQATSKQVCSTEVSCEETVESPSAAAPSQNCEGHNMHNMTQVIVGRDPDNDAGHFVFNVYDSESYWGILD